MRLILGAAIAFAVLLPAAAFGAAPAQTSQDWCKANPASIGAGKAYKNFGACVSAHNVQQETNAVNAAKTCKAERASIGVEAFASKYGTNPNKKNAFGKCVSKIAKAKTGQQQAAEAKATEACMADPLKGQIGEGKTYKNFGACVSAQAKKK
jgi:hypothetical protein